MYSYQTGLRLSSSAALRTPSFFPPPFLSPLSLTLSRFLFSSYCIPFPTFPFLVDQIHSKYAIILVSDCGFIFPSLFSLICSDGRSLPRNQKARVLLLSYPRPAPPRQNHFQLVKFNSNRSFSASWSVLVSRIVVVAVVGAS